MEHSHIGSGHSKTGKQPLARDKWVWLFCGLLLSMKTDGVEVCACLWNQWWIFTQGSNLI